MQMTPKLVDTQKRSLLSASIIGGAWFFTVLFMLTTFGTFTFFMLSAIVAPLLAQAMWEKWGAQVMQALPTWGQLVQGNR